MKKSRSKPLMMMLASLLMLLPAALPAAEPTAQQQAEAAYRKGLIAERAGNAATAKEAYETALRLYPRHADARYRLGQVKLNYAKIGAEGREKRFAGVLIPEYKVDEASLADALGALSTLVDTASEQQVAANFIIQDPAGKLAERKITLVMKGTPASGILRYVLEMAGAKARFDEHAIVIMPL